MEMQEIPTESPQSNEEEGAGEPMQEVITQEEAEPVRYESLQSPPEDVYAEAFPPAVKPGEAILRIKKEKPDEAELSVELQGEKGKQDEGKTGLYRLLCFILAVICLILLVVAVVLGVKLQTESTLCQRNDRFNDRQSPPTCSLENCQNSFPKMAFKKLPCRQCASGWLTFGTSCFFLSTTRLTWFESQKNCSSGGGSLAIVTNQTVQNFLTRKGNLKYWIGLRHEVSSWNWVNNNKLQQSYWTESVQNGDCAYLNGDGPAEKNWDRAPCRASTYFICQLQF